MYLLYLDESGRPRPGVDQHLVVAGLAVHEEDCYPLARSLRNVQRKWVGVANADLELHASEIWSGRATWAHVDVQTRHKLVRAVFRHLSNWTAPSGRAPKYFGVVVHTPSYPRTAMERAHEELFARFDEFLTRLVRGGDPHRSMVVADESGYESLVQTWVPQWKHRSRTGPLHSFVDVPLYVDSKASRLVQAADFVAWAIWQYYQNGHAEHLQRINSRLDADGGVQHGLAHVRRGYRTCGCLPCESRRSHTVGEQVPQRNTFR